MSYKEYVLHNGRAKEVHGKFGTMIMFKDNGTIKSVLANNLKFCDAAGNVLDDAQQKALMGNIDMPELGNSTPIPVTVKIGNNNPLPIPVSPFRKQEYPTVNTGLTGEERKERELSSTNREGGEERKEREEEEVYNINVIQSEADIKQVASAVSGLGYKTLKTIIANRPDDGYVSAEHIRDVNGSQIPKNIRWSAIEDYLSFS